MRKELEELGYPQEEIDGIIEEAKQMVQLIAEVLFLDIHQS